MSTISHTQHPSFPKTGHKLLATISCVRYVFQAYRGPTAPVLLTQQTQDVESMFVFTLVQRRRLWTNVKPIAL